MPGILDGRIKIYWCDGNHEDHDALDKLEALKARGQKFPGEKPAERFIEIMPGVHFAPFGSVLRLFDGTTVLFCGEADSIDKARRTPGKSWWAQETIDENDMAKLPPPDSLTVDWVISHTCPLDFDVRSSNEAKEADPSKRFLDTVLALYSPKRWWFGHYHDYQTGEYENCAWTLLSRIGDPKGKAWVLELPLLES